MIRTSKSKQGPPAGTIQVRMSRKNKDLIPLIMWIVLVAAIIVFAYIRLRQYFSIWDEWPVNIDVLFISLYILWMIIELRISKKDLHARGKTTYDSMACQLYGVGQALTFLTALWYSSAWREPHVAHIVGIGFFIIGGCYRLWAIRSLGRYYSHRVRLEAQHRVVASGPYRTTRHPAYAGMIMANAGICIYFCNFVTLCAYLLILIPAIFFRIMVEEKTLFKLEGYAEFARNRKRLFPWVW